MIVVDTGPLVALFDPRDGLHEECRRRLRAMKSSLLTTLPVLTEAFHILSPESRGADRLRAFVMEGGAALAPAGDADIERAFELMETYRNVPMDLADASVVVAAERLETRKVFTLDVRDFAVYRVRKGHRHYAVEIV